MGIDWSSLDEVDGAEFILRCALRDGAEKIAIKRDPKGGKVYFIAGGEPVFFDLLPLESSSAVRRYLKRVVAIDPYMIPPQNGFSAIELDEVSYALSVLTSTGQNGEDLTITLSKL
ncbi:MAG: hypothetical protein JXA52_08580 [Planctomycetes bacterium]|nr:hypothetical protein [Planctomycetota bacterium]